MILQYEIQSRYIHGFPFNYMYSYACIEANLHGKKTEDYKSKSSTITHIVIIQDASRNTLH